MAGETYDLKPKSLVCPECSILLVEGSVICVHCGHDFRTGTKVKQPLTATERPAESSTSKTKRRGKTAKHRTETATSSASRRRWVIGGLTTGLLILCWVIIFRVPFFTLFDEPETAEECVAALETTTTHMRRALKSQYPDDIIDLAKLNRLTADQRQSKIQI